MTSAASQNPTGAVGGDSDSESDDGHPLARLDFSGVDFDATDDGDLEDGQEIALAWERSFAFQQVASPTSCDLVDGTSFGRLAEHLENGRYAAVLRDDVARDFFESIVDIDGSTRTVVSRIRNAVVARGMSVMACLEMELLGVAALNLFLQINYTGPSLEQEGESSSLVDINPHRCFTSQLNATSDEDEEESKSQQEEKKEHLTSFRSKNMYHNAVLSELAVDGEWPCQICDAPYFLLLARSILSMLSNPSCAGWTRLGGSGEAAQKKDSPVSSPFVCCSSKLSAVHLWNARAAVAHQRLLQTREPSTTLWTEVEIAFKASMDEFCPQQSESTTDESNLQAATVMLEKGLAEHHFDRPGKGKNSFGVAKRYSGLQVEVTGAVGKRTKYQQHATAQMLVRAKSTTSEKQTSETDVSKQQDGSVKGQIVDHSEDGILLERIKFDDEKENAVDDLSILDQAILLAFCLDVKNNNPVDGLTAEQMGAYLARVLAHHDDWMVYATGLLERSWLEFERSHARERALFQMQALVDQHTNRLTFLQSTKECIEESAPVQDRLRNLHLIVYPPRWSIVRDLAERYAKMGVVTAAAELYTTIEYWDEVVECYRRLGKTSKAEQIAREVLATAETPSMWAALGDISGNPEYYQRAIELSNGRFSSAYVSLGKYHFDKGELEEASVNYERALELRPLAPTVWFRLGTISMQLSQWQTALRAFSEVVQQEPEEADAWANVAAVHMHNKQPAEAYPALVESLRYNRSNWRVWTSMLYTCLDLEKYDEAVQACNILLDLSGEGVPELEEKCVKAVVGGAVRVFQACQEDDAVGLDSARRTLTRVHALLDRLSSSSQAKPWIFEALVHVHDQVGSDEKVIENLMKEYRSLQAVQGWEKDDLQVVRLCRVVSNLTQIHLRKGDREGMTRDRFLIRSVVKKIQLARGDGCSFPEEVTQLETLLRDIDSKLNSK